MNFKTELLQMRKNYEQNPLSKINLPCPFWAYKDSNLNILYKRKDTLIKHGKVYYAFIVQANEMLFRFLPHIDCPANLIYSFDDAVCENPMLLAELSMKLFSYKNTDLASIPEKWRNLSEIITSEQSSKAYEFSYTTKSGTSINVCFNANMIFRKHLPHRMIKGSVLPVLAIPEMYESVLILPKKYWSKEFKSEWIKKEI